ncbi:MAG TPA: hypothetical protein VLQ79_01925, partial [Myxococcaceae bacterium]|nr:hypothetical protein [Myxococcaceae bacterium]
FGADLLDVGTLSYDVPFPGAYLSLPLEATGSFTLFVLGDSPRFDSGCSSEPSLAVVFAPGQSVSPGQ